MGPKDNVFALSTPKGKSALAVFRISGLSSHKIIQGLSSNKKIIINKTNLNYILDKNKKPIDQTLTTFFKSPKSFTGEDVVEISVHGSSAVLNKILSILGNSTNCRIADPGEFTRRAFENNKLDLTQIEALADLINSETEAQRKQAVEENK